MGKAYFKKHLIPITFLLFLQTGILSVTGCTTTPNFKTAAEHIPPGFSVKALPVFILPEADSKNGIRAIFLDNSKKNILSITVVFADEDHPSAFTDFIYDIYRHFKYKRTEDVETFNYYYSKQSDIKNGFPEKVIFPTTYSKNQPFFTKDVKHYTETVAFSAFTLKENRPLIFINTWNHLFSENNNNRDLKLNTIENYPVYIGSRADVEKLYRGR